MNKEDQDLIIKNGEPRSGIFLNKPAYYVGIENLVNAKQLWSLRDFLRYMKDYFLKEDKEKKDKLFKKHLIESVDINIDELKNDTYLPFDIENLMSILKKIDGHSYVETDSDALFKVYIYSGTERCSILKNLNVGEEEFKDGDGFQFLNLLNMNELSNDTLLQLLYHYINKKIKFDKINRTWIMGYDNNNYKSNSNPNPNPNNPLGTISKAPSTREFKGGRRNQEKKSKNQKKSRKQRKSRK